jgi:hypothetical protein
LDLRRTFIDAAPGALKSRIESLVDMMKVNTSIQTILLGFQYNQHELFRESVIPYLETNRFRPRLLAIQKTRPIPYRVKVLGRALLSARTDPNRFWTLLSGNVEVAFPSTAATIAAAANPPTPATAAATSTTNVAAAALTTTGTGSLPTTVATSTATSAFASDAFPFAHTAATATVATPSAGQKHRARP